MAGDAAIANGKSGIQVHGGIGFTWEVDAQRFWKRATVLDTHFGNTRTPKPSPPALTRSRHALSEHRANRTTRDEIDGYL